MDEQIRWSVRFYQDRGGRRPVEEWILELDEKDQARIRRAFGVLAIYGTRLGMPHSRHVRGKIWELRIAAGGADYRVLYVAAVSRLFILLHAFSKKTAKTPMRELEIAEARLMDYQLRSKWRETL